MKHLYFCTVLYVSNTTYSSCWLQCHSFYPIYLLSDFACESWKFKTVTVWKPVATLTTNRIQYTTLFISLKQDWQVYSAAVWMQSLSLYPSLSVFIYSSTPSGKTVLRSGAQIPPKALKLPQILSRTAHHHRAISSPHPNFTNRTLLSAQIMPINESNSHASVQHETEWVFQVDQ